MKKIENKTNSRFGYGDKIKLEKNKKLKMK